CDLREPGCVRKPVAHDPVQGVGRVDDEVPSVPGWAAYVPAAVAKATAETLAYLRGGDHARRVPASKRKVEKAGEGVEKGLGISEGWPRVPAAMDRLEQRRQRRHEQAAVKGLVERASEIARGA